jgi:competence protein ComEC
MRPGAEPRGLAFFAAMAGSVLGAALQLQQAALWDRAVYSGLLLVAAAVWLSLRRWRRSALAMLLLGAMVGAGLAGWRAAVYAGDALAPALEGRDLQVVGIVSQMPQRGDGAVRFLFDVESAR